MLEAIIQDLIRNERPYYSPQGNPIKGLDNQYWLVFKHRDADSLLKNIASFFGLGSKNDTHIVVRIDLQDAKVYHYIPKKQGDVPSVSLLRIGNIKSIEKFLKRDRVTKEPALLEGSLRAIKGNQRRYNLPDELAKYNIAIAQMLERSSIYRRSTAYFDSGILKFYEEPLQSIIQTDGRILLLMDWQGFTKKSDISELEKLQDPDYRAQFAQRTLQEFLQGLADSIFSHTEILAELVRLEFLQIKLIKMEQGRAIYHKKTGIFSDALDNHILHEGSDNFTRAAHSRNAESVTFLYSWDDLDREAIAQSIQQFDQEWHRQDLAFDISLEFLQQVRAERDRRAQFQKPNIKTISPDQFPSGETTKVEITGDNLDQVTQVTVIDDPLVEVKITDQTQDLIKADVAVSADHPPQTLNDFRVRDKKGEEYKVNPAIAPKVSNVVKVPEFPEILGFKEAIEKILAGEYGAPNDFLYWMAKQRPNQFRVKQDSYLDELINQGILYEHQKSGAQHCLRVMQDFGVAVCADAVGLGKTRLAAAVAYLYREQKEQQGGQAKIAIVAAQKLWANWEREMSELGFRRKDYELFNKNLMSRKVSKFVEEFNRFEGADLVIIDEAHEGIRNFNNRIHKTCLQIREQDQRNGKQRQFLLLTATPWNNRREDIYNILSPFLTRLEGFKEVGFPPEVSQWFASRESGVENFTDRTDLFRRVYKQLFLQRTRQMLREAMPEMNVYAKRLAEWLPVQFEPSTEQALEQIFTQFETSLYIPFADPLRYFTGTAEQRSLLKNQRRFFLQRAESSMYALRRTIVNFRMRIDLMRSRLAGITPDAIGLNNFLLEHYGFSKPVQTKIELDYEADFFMEDEDYEEEEEEENTDPETSKETKRQQLRTQINKATDALIDNPEKAQQIYNLMLSACEQDLLQMEQIQNLLADEFLKDHKREQVTQQVKTLISQGKKVLLISTFSDTVLDYYLHMSRDSAIASQGIGMAIGSTKSYFPENAKSYLNFAPHNFIKNNRQTNGIKRQQLFRLFAPVATCKNPSDRPNPSEEVMVLIGSETLSVGQNLQDADYLINIDLPWNPMTLEQRIGRIDRPKQHKAENIVIYYANSESQLLRQASRLKNLNKKLVGDLANPDGEISNVTDANTLGASVYGDTLFDDPILPGYVDFIQSLAKARNIEHINLQEEVYRQQENSHDLYTHQEILYAEDLSQKIAELGKDYQANAIALGQSGDKKTEPQALTGLTVKYFDPNGAVITEQEQKIFWNDQTGERDAYGVAIATAFNTPEISEVIAANCLLTSANNLYKQLTKLKQHLSTDLAQADTIANITVDSERLSKIKKRVALLSSYPQGISRQDVTETLKKLNSCKHFNQVQKLLKDYTTGEKAKLDHDAFVAQLVADTDKLNLLAIDNAQASSLQVSLQAMLIRL
jgi:superfamily II DNA or RNA helicase